MAMTLPRVIVTAASMATTAAQLSTGSAAAKTRMKAAKPAPFEATESQAVMGVGAPS